MGYLWRSGAIICNEQLQHEIQVICSQTCLSGHLSIAVSCLMQPLKIQPPPPPPPGKIITVLKTL